MSPRSLLPIKVVTARVGLCRSSVYRLIALDQFPKPIKVLGAHGVRWDSNDIDTWIDAAVVRVRGKSDA